MTADCHDIRVTAHRGMTYDHVENTILAFNAAVNAGFDLETDLRTTKNGDILLIHNADIAAVTNGSGLVANMTTSQIRQYHTSENTVIPYLIDALAILQSHPGRRAFLELKAMTTTSMGKLRDRLTEYGVRDQVMVYSFYTDLITQYQGIDPAAETSVIYSTLPTIGDATIAGAAHVHMSLVTQEWADAMHAAGLQFYARDSAERADWALAFQWGSPTQTTDDPLDFRAWCNGH